MSTREEAEEATRAYVNGDKEQAYALLRKVSDDAPLSPEGIGSRFLLARGLEDGFFSGTPDPDAAYEQYRELSTSEGARDYALLGCARILFHENAKRHRDTIERLCMEAISLRGNRKAMMLLGATFEQVDGDHAAARRWYSKAALRGMPWGIRYLARSHHKSGNALRAAALHTAATVVGPVVYLLGGPRSPFK